MPRVSKCSLVIIIMWVKLGMALRMAMMEMMMEMLGWLCSLGFDKIPLLSLLKPSLCSCQQRLRVNVLYQYAFTWKRALSCVSLAHLLEFFFVLAATMAFSWIFYSVMAKGEGRDVPNYERYLLLCGFAFTTSISILALNAVVRRWKKSISVKTILPMYIQDVDKPNETKRT